MATPDSTQANGLLCWLRCDEAAGDLIDASDRHYDAQIVTPPTYRQPGIPTLGFGYGVRTNDAGAVATIDQSDDLFWNVRCQTVSVQAWFKANQAFMTMPGTKHALVHKSSVYADTRGWYLGVLPAGLGDADPASWSVKALPASVSDMAFGNGVYVAVGVNAHTSVDGVVWTDRGALPIQCTSIAFGAGRFVAVGSATNTTQQAIWSTDGINWTRVTTHSSAIGLSSVTFGAGLFVATVNASGLSNLIVTSPTGSVWTERACPTTNVNYRVYYGNGKFIAVGVNRVMVSVNGTSWTDHAAVAATWYDVVFGGTKFVAVGAAGKIMSSPDGTTWTEETSGTSRILVRIAHGDNVFTAVSSDGAADCIFTSPTGATWINRTAPSGVRAQVRFFDHRFTVISFASTSIESARFSGAVTNAIVFRIMDAAGSKYDASYTEAEFTQFHHYVGTYDGAFVRLYRDSVLVVSAAVSGIIGHDPLYKTTIGEGLDGTLDDVAVWNRALTQAEVTRLYGEATYWKVVQKFRVYDTLWDVYPGTVPTFAIDYIHPFTLTIGPFPWTVQVKSGDEVGLSPVTAPNDQLMVNGVAWTTPAWVNVSTAHTIAAGTIIATLTPGQTMTLQVRAKTANASLYASGVITVFRAGVAGEGLNIVLPPFTSAAGSTDMMDTIVADYAPIMADGLLEPANLVAVPFDAIAVPGDFDNVSSASADDNAPTGLTQEFDLYENILIDPLPEVISITADANKFVTLVGDAGFTNIQFVDLYFEVEVSTGMLVIPVSATWQPFSLTARQRFTATYQIPACISLSWRRARFVAEANGPGSTEQAIRYYSAWTTLQGIEYIHACPDAAEPKLPRQVWIYQNSNIVVGTPNPTTLMNAFRGAVEAWSACHWTVDQYVEGDCITFKRKGVQTGTLGAFRAMMFGRRTDQSAPSQAALAGANASILATSTDALFIGVSDDAGASAMGSPVTGAPFPGKHWSGGVGFGSLFGGMTGPVGVLVISCERMLVFVVYGANSWAFAVVGECIVGLDTPTTGIWGCMASGRTLVDAAQGMDAVLGAPLPMTDGQACFGSYNVGDVQKRLLRGTAIAPNTVHDPLYEDGVNTGILLPITVETGDMNGSTRELVGVLRQICLGPYLEGRRIVRDVLDVPRAIALNGGTDIVGSGLYLNMDV